MLLGSILVGMPVGSFYSWSVFIDPIQRARPDFSSSTSVHANSVVISALSISCAATGKILGYKYGLKQVSAVGAVVSALGLVMCGLSVLYGIEWMLLAGGGLNGLGMGAPYVCFIKAFKTTFHDFPGFAAGWVMFASSAGSFVFVWVSHALLDHFKRAYPSSEITAPAVTFFILGGILLLMQFTGSFLLVETPTVKKNGDSEPNGDESGAEIDESDSKSDRLEAPLIAGEANSKEAKRTARPVLSSTRDVLSSIQFWLVMFVFFSNLFPVLGVLTIFASYVQSRFPGTTSTMAANSLAIINVVGTAWRLLVGFISKHVGRFELFVIALILQTALFATLAFTIDQSDMTLSLFTGIVCVCKICYGSGFTLINLLIDEVFGKANGTQVYGLVIFGLMAASLASPNIASVWYKKSDSADATFDNEEIRPYFIISFAVTTSGVLSLLLLRCMSRNRLRG